MMSTTQTPSQSLYHTFSSTKLPSQNILHSVFSGILILFLFFYTCHRNKNSRRHVASFSCRKPRTGMNRSSFRANLSPLLLWTRKSSSTFFLASHFTAIFFFSLFKSEKGLHRTANMASWCLTRIHAGYEMECVCDGRKFLRGNSKEILKKYGRKNSLFSTTWHAQ